MAPVALRISSNSFTSEDSSLPYCPQRQCDPPKSWLSQLLEVQIHHTGKGTWFLSDLEDTVSVLDVLNTDLFSKLNMALEVCKVLVTLASEQQWVNES